MPASSANDIPRQLTALLGKKVAQIRETDENPPRIQYGDEPAPCFGQRSAAVFVINQKSRDARMAEKFSIPKQPARKNIPLVRCDGTAGHRCSIANTSSMVDVVNGVKAEMIKNAPLCLRADLGALFGMSDGTSLPSRFVSLWPELIRNAPIMRPIVGKENCYDLGSWDPEAMRIAHYAFGSRKCCLQA